MNIVVVPGFMGSGLFLPGPPNPLLGPRLWLNQARILRGDVGLLSLDAAGTGPGPLANGQRLLVGGPLDDYYGPLVVMLTDLGHVVKGYGWDWRQSITLAAPGLATASLGLFGDDPFTWVCHSAGGLVARLAAAYLDARGKLGQLTRIIYLGTPHFGTWLPVDALTRRNVLYKRLCAWMPSPAGSPSGTNAALDLTMTSFVSLWELLPFRDFGPYHDGDPASVAALYDASNWRPIGQTPLQARLDNAAVTQGMLRTAGYQTLSASIYNDGAQTPSGYVSGVAGEPIFRCVYSPDGDDTVERESSVSQWTVRLGFAPSGHQEMPVNSAVWKAIKNLLPSP